MEGLPQTRREAVTELITRGPEVVEYLQKVLGAFPWPAFEAVQTGNMTITGVEFKLRLGLHMKQPRQVIVAIGYFVKIKPAPKDTLKDITADLDPNDPDKCLFNADRWWHPRWSAYYGEKPDAKPDWVILNNAHIFNSLGGKK